MGGGGKVQQRSTKYTQVPDPSFLGCTGCTLLLCATMCFKQNRFEIELQAVEPIPVPSYLSDLSANKR